MAEDGAALCFGADGVAWDVDELDDGDVEDVAEFEVPADFLGAECVEGSGFHFTVGCDYAYRTPSQAS